MPAAVMVHAEGVTKRFGNVWALRGIDLQLMRGRCLSIFGPNGAGKTTFLKLLATVMRPSAGAVTIAGYDTVREAEKVRPLLGVLGHKTFLYGHLTAYENLQFYGRMFGIARCAERSTEMLRAVGLEDACTTIGAHLFPWYAAASCHCSGSVASAGFVVAG